MQAQHSHTHHRRPIDRAVKNRSDLSLLLSLFYRGDFLLALTPPDPLRVRYPLDVRAHREEERLNGLGLISPSLSFLHSVRPRRQQSPAFFAPFFPPRFFLVWQRRL